MSWIKTKNGIELQDTDDILKDVQGAFTSIYPDLNLDPATPQGQLITFITECIRNAQSDIVELANVFHNGGDGVFLDIRNQTLYGIYRKRASKGSVVAIISGQTGITIPVGLRAKAGEYTYVTTYTSVIASHGECEITMEAEQEGDWQIQIGELNEFATIPVPKGIERITNRVASVKGQSLETDSEYRHRAKSATLHETSSIFGGLLSQLKQIEGVEDVGGFENVSNKPVVHRGTEMPPHSINIICKGGTEKQIAETILRYKNPGCDMGGNVEIFVLDDVSEQAYKVNFYRPTIAEIKAEIKIRIGNNVTQDFEAQIKNKLMDYVNNLRFGGDIYLYEAVNCIELSNLKVIEFKLYDKKLGNKGESVINLTFLQEPLLLEEDIEIIVDDVKLGEDISNANSVEKP